MAPRAPTRLGRSSMTTVHVCSCVVVLLVGACRPAGGMAAGATAAPTREASIERAQAEKAATLHPYVPNRVEAFLNRFEETLANGGRGWHPFFDSAYSGGCFTLGAGYKQFVSHYNSVDVRGSY